MAINPSVHSQLTVSIHQSNLQFKKIHQIFEGFLPWRSENAQLPLKTTVKSVQITKALKRRLNF
jgi:hypothetical protein